MEQQTIETEHLYLRQWQASDFSVFTEMNADLDVMRYFPKPLSSKLSDAIANKCSQLIEDKGWGFWTVSLKEQDTFIGMVGLNKAHADRPFSPTVEMAWRLHKDY